MDQIKLKSMIRSSLIKQILKIESSLKFAPSNFGDFKIRFIDALYENGFSKSSCETLEEDLDIESFDEIYETWNLIKEEQSSQDWNENISPYIKELTRSITERFNENILIEAVCKKMKVKK